VKSDVSITGCDAFDWVGFLLPGCEHEVKTCPKKEK